MKLERLNEQNKAHFAEAFALYESAFPREERRDRDEQERILQNPDYHFDMILENGQLLGILLYWQIGELIFLEHFSTFPALRGNGIGSQALTLLKDAGKIILPEIEVPVDELTNRRLGFYQRNGFLMNPYYHIQAKYHQGDADLELKILSFPEVLTEGEYRDFYSYMLRHVSIQ